MIELRKVSYEYKLDGKRSILALDDVSLTFEPGECVAIIGSNGSGKTTLARLLNALLLPTSGKVLVEGSDSGDKDSQRRIRLKVGMVFQNPDNQLVSTSVEREIAFGLENLALSYEQMEKRVKWALDYFHLERYSKYPPHKLSGGEKQRVALASVLCTQPKYLVLDEPTSLLDALGKKEVMSLVETFCKQKKVTIVHITQFPEETVIADRVLVMDRGRVVLDGPPRDVFEQRDKLREIGVQPPLATRIASELSRRGIIPSDDYLTMDDVTRNLDPKIRRDKKKPEQRGNQVGPELTSTHGKLESPSAKSGRIEPISEGSPQILVQDVSYLYNPGLPTERQALYRVNLKINKGDFVGLVGPTGSGKTTLVQHLNALMIPMSGKVLLEDIDLSAASREKDKAEELKEVRQKVGLVFQFPELQLFEDTVYDDIAFGPKNLGMSEERVDENVRNSMRKMGLDFDGFASRSPFSLSGGEQRKVAIAGILALDPEILVLDEPTCGLDSKSSEEIQELLKHLNSIGATVILVSHNMDLIAELAEKIILLDQGKVISFCSKENFFKDTEKIKSIGLDPPKVMEFVQKLEEKGFEIEGQILTEEDLALCLDRFLTVNSAGREEKRKNASPEMG